MVGLLVRWPDDPEHEKVLVFKLISTEPDAAATFANQVCKQLANLHYTTDHVSLYVYFTFYVRTYMCTHCTYVCTYIVHTYVRTYILIYIRYVYAYICIYVHTYSEVRIV